MRRLTAGLEAAWGKMDCEGEEGEGWKALGERLVRMLLLLLFLLVVEVGSLEVEVEEEEGACVGLYGDWNWNCDTVLELLCVGAGFTGPNCASRACNPGSGFSVGS